MHATIRIDRRNCYMSEQDVIEFVKEAPHMDLNGRTARAVLRDEGDTTIIKGTVVQDGTDLSINAHGAHTRLLVSESFNNLTAHGLTRVSIW